MKSSIPRILVALGLGVALPLARAADPAPAPKEEKKTLRVITSSSADGETPRAGTSSRRVITVGRTGTGSGEKESVAFLGVETLAVGPTLAAQLNLTGGTGLVVSHIVPDTSAAAALKEHDILLKLDDQILIEQRQLGVLIRQHKEGDEVTLTYLRGGKQASAKVKLGKHDVPKISISWDQAAPGGNIMTLAPGGGGGGTFELVTPEPGQAVNREEIDRVLSLIERRHGELPLTMRIDRGGVPGSNTFYGMSVNTGNSNLSFSDDDGSLDLTIKDGAKTLVAKNAKGEQVFSGPVTTPEERKALPDTVRGRLEKLEGMQGFTFRTDNDFKGTETKIFRPAGRGIALPLIAPLPAPTPSFY